MTRGCHSRRRLTLPIYHKLAVCPFVCFQQCKNSIVIYPQMVPLYIIMSVGQNSVVVMQWLLFWVPPSIRI